MQSVGVPELNLVLLRLDPVVERRLQLRALACCAQRRPIAHLDHFDGLLAGRCARKLADNRSTMASRGSVLRSHRLLPLLQLLQHRGAVFES